jgi:4-hydroxybenzoate polyprenyltransferase
MTVIAFALLMSARTHAIPPTSLLPRLALYALGSALLRCAACVLNDICDIEIDRKVGTYGLLLTISA